MSLKIETTAICFRFHIRDDIVHINDVLGKCTALRRYDERHLSDAGLGGVLVRFARGAGDSNKSEAKQPCSRGRHQKRVLVCIKLEDCVVAFILS